MINYKLKLVCLEYCHRFERLKVKISTSDLQKLANKEAIEAEKNYHGLAEPKTCSLDTYIALWVKEALEKKFISKTLQKLDSKNSQDIYAQSLSSFFSFVPLKLIPPMKKEIFNVPFSKRKDVWQSFNLPLKEIETKFKNLTKERIKYVSERNFSPFFEVFLEKNKISRETYNEFVGGIDKLIVDLNSQLPKIKDLPTWFYSEFNLPCFICQLPELPFISTSETLDFVSKEYPVLKEFKQKVKVKFTQDEKTFAIYRTKHDFIEISLGKEANIRHRSISLIHELCHAITLLDSLKKGEDELFIGGKYEAEKRAIKIQTKLLKKISEPLYWACLGEILLFPFRNTLFEIELYQNPDRDVSKLYAESFNRCFLKAKQKDNPLYLLDERIISEPFALLPHAIAHYQELNRFFS